MHPHKTDLRFLYADNAYIEFHDECWGVPAYDDK